MIIRNLSIKSKLILTTLILVLLLMALGLIFLDTKGRLARQTELLEDQWDLNSGFISLQNSFLALPEKESPEALSDLLYQAHSLTEQIGRIQTHEITSGNELLTRKAEQANALLARFEEALREVPGADQPAGTQAKTDLTLLGAYLKEINQVLFDAEDHARKQQTRLLVTALALGIFLVANLLIIFAMNLQRSFQALTDQALQFSKGSIPPPLDSGRRDEFGVIAGHMNRLAEELQKKIHWISSMSGEGSGEIFRPESEDELGNALLVLSNYMTRNELQEVTRIREDKKQNWISEGMSQLGEVLRTERNDVIQLSFLIIQKLVNYMNVEMGSLFVTNESDPGHPRLDLAATYAYDRRKYKSMSLEWGEGLPGTCALEKERIFLTDVPPDYFELASGLGHSRPNCVLLVPLKHADAVVGVLELATVRLLRPFEIEFVESQSERIASSLTAVRNNERTGLLLQQSQEQAEALRERDAAMQESMTKLEQAQKNSIAKESEISGILNAINQSTLVAEFGLNGRYVRINEKFLMLLGSQEDQVLGKHYSEFAAVDRASDSYKAFWATLKEGKSVSNTEKYKLFTGEEVWLQQTLTPITNNEGRVQRILNIAFNITEERSLQQQLSTRELEIKRRGLDMQTLNQAVNASLIKCELDAQGIILDVNDNYCETTGYQRKELLGRNCRLFMKDMEKEQFEMIWNEVVKEKVYEGSIRRTRPTGEEVWLASILSPVKDEAGNIYKVYFMGLDITEKRLKYQLLEDANREIERLKNQLKELEA